MSELAPSTLPIALVYGEAGVSAHVREVLGAFESNIVYDSAVDALDQSALSDSGAKVALVNLDSVLEERLDDVYGMLEACGCRVVFNDPGNSVKLQGWEQARWARHLVAKLHDDGNVDPPRPAGAEAVDVLAAASLSDAWLGEALDALGVDLAAAPADATALPGADDCNAANDHAATSAPAEDAPDGDDFTLGDSADIDSVATAPGAVDMAEGLDVSVAARAEAGAEDPVWLELEQQLSATFATKSGAEEPVAEPGSEATHAVAVAQADTLSIDWSLLDDDESQGVGEPMGPVDQVAGASLHLVVDDANATSVGSDLRLVPTTDSSAATDGAPTSGAAVAPAFDDMPASQWTLVDDTVEPATVDQPFAVHDDPAADGGDDDKLRAATDTVADSLATRDFGIELVDPIDYLAPEAPPPREAELYAAPELMPMVEALAPQPIDERIHAEATAAGLPRIVVMGASIGGPDAVREFLSGLPVDFPALFVLVQHMGSEFIDLLTSQLSKSSAMPVRVPASGERARTGEVLVVPNGGQLELTRNGSIKLAAPPEDAVCEPSIKATMTMAAEVFGADALAIVFSGMVGDAVSGTAAIASHGGSVWTQDRATCVVSTMVDSVSAAGTVGFSGTPAALAQRLIETFTRDSAS